jgi:hypothetical protein
MAIDSLTVSRDRQTLFFASKGAIYALPTADGSPRKIAQGDAVAAYPGGDELVVQLFEPDGARLARVNAAAGTTQPIEFSGEARLALMPMTGTAVDRGGDILVTVTQRHLWFWRPGLVTPTRRRLEPIPLDYQGDIIAPAWTSDGRVVSIGQSLSARLWRFRPRPS